MKITSGLFDNMVLQRDRQNLSRARFAGECQHDGVLFARINNGKTVKCGICEAPRGPDSKRSGRGIFAEPCEAKNAIPPCGKPQGFAYSAEVASATKAGLAKKGKKGKFKGVLTGLKTGGPYEIELFVKDPQGKAVEKTRVRNVLVGDVWILGGQSNMEGIGHLKYAAKPQNKVRAFYMDDRWDIAKDPVHNISKAIDQVHADLAGGKPPARAPHVGVGPGVAFGQEMFRRNGVPQGLISCAHGGSSMSQWDPALKSKGGKSLYGAMIRRFHKNGGKVAGGVWYQGCSDASQEHMLYTRRMIALVRAMRNDFGDPRLPVAAVQIAGVYSTSSMPQLWNSIQEQQRLLPKKIRDLTVVPAIDLSFDDQIHISGFDQNRLGKRLAQAMRVLRHEKNAGLPPIELQSITNKIEKRTGVRLVLVKFRNVMGRLQSSGKPSGFFIEEDNISPCIFRTDLEKDTAILKIQLPFLRQFLAIHYGHGLAPYCNITDSADRSLPVFGPAILKLDN